MAFHSKHCHLYTKVALDKPAKLLAADFPLPSVEKEAKKCTILKWLGVNLNLELPLSPENENEENAWLRMSPNHDERLSRFLSIFSLSFLQQLSHGHVTWGWPFRGAAWDFESGGSKAAVHREIWSGVVGPHGQWL